MQQQPPLNFALVCPGVHRSGFPSRHNVQFLKRLRLRSLICLASGSYAPEVRAWIDSEGINVLSQTMTPNREPFVTMDCSTIIAALRDALDPSNQPVLVHCLKGQQQTGVLVGCMRKLQRWSLAAIFDEYRRYAGPAVSLMDLQMIELIDLHGESLVTPGESEGEGGDNDDDDDNDANADADGVAAAAAAYDAAVASDTRVDATAQKA